MDLPLEIFGHGSGEAQRPPHGAYLHVPFCFHKCHYCDFYSIVDSRDRQDAFVDRMIAEAEAAARYLTRPLETIFVGGGTPTLLSTPQWSRLGRALQRLWPRSPEMEFTIEANPETVTPELAAVLVDVGVNRVSVGAQSFDRAHLETLERHHDPENVARAIDIFRTAGIRNVSLDLIFAIPGQSLRSWMDDLETALQLAPDHLSCYGLMYEPNTPLTARRRAGRIQPVDADVEADMYEATIDRLAGAGYEHYEISNWSRPGRRCAHNMMYWNNHPWWPFGPSASGHLDGWRWKNVPRLAEYIEHGPFPRITDVERLDDDGRVGEALMLGLRLIDGISDARLRTLLSQGRRGAERRAHLERCGEEGLVDASGGRTRLTRRGLLVGDTVLGELV